MKALSCLMLAAGLSGCATVSPQPEPEPEPLSQVLQALALSLPGQYATPVTQDDAHARTLLSVQADQISEPGALRLLLEQQRDLAGSTPRLFLWVLRGQDADRLKGQFAPLGRDGQIGRQCDMSVMARRDGITAQTDPEQCRFDSGDGPTGLLKEIAFDGSQLVIGDRLFSLSDGEPLDVDQVTRFVPIREFSGWAGVRDGDRWRMSRDISVHTASGTIEPDDAARMSLGIRIELAHYLMARTDRIVLRLAAHDMETGSLRGEAWADLDARSIGLALPDLQVGLDLAD